MRAVVDGEEVDADAETTEASGRPTRAIVRADANDNGDVDADDAIAEAAATLEGADDAEEVKDSYASEPLKGATHVNDGTGGSVSEAMSNGIGGRVGTGGAAATTMKSGVWCRNLAISSISVVVRA